VSDVSDEDAAKMIASDLSATSRACRARGICKTTRHTDKRVALHTAADRRLTNQVSVWQAERGSRPTRSRGIPALLSTLAAADV